MDEELVHIVKTATYGRGVDGSPFVSAEGEVGSSGWTNISLRLTTTEPPEDGIYAFDFHAAPPSEPQPAVQTPVSAQVRWDGVDQAVGVRIRAKTNEILAEHVVG